MITTHLGYRKVRRAAQLLNLSQMQENTVGIGKALCQPSK